MSEIQVMQAIHDALREEMLRDEKVFIIGEDIGIYGGCFGVTRGLKEEFDLTPDENTPIGQWPEPPIKDRRLIEPPIVEGGFTGIAVGAAMYGYRPVVEYMFSDFVTCAMDHVVNQAAKQRFMLGGQCKMPLVIRFPGGCGTGAAAQHSQSLEAWMCHVPGLICVAPSNPYDAKGLLKAAIRSDNPICFYEHKLGYRVKGEVPDGEDYTLPLNKAKVAREGKDITLISYSYTTVKCLEAAKQLEAEGIDVEVLDLICINPIDRQAIIDSVKKTGNVLIAHEGVQKCGVGAEVAGIIADSEAFYYLDRPIVRFGGCDDMPIPYNKELEYSYIPQVETICDKIRDLLK